MHMCLSILNTLELAGATEELSAALSRFAEKERRLARGQDICSGRF
jgi:hypothetical protein